MEAVTVRKKSKIWAILITVVIIVALVVIAVFGLTVLGNSANGKVLTQNLSEPLGDATSARFDIRAGTGNLTIDGMAKAEEFLASGKLEYLEGQDLPAFTIDKNNGLYTLTLKASGGKQTGFQLPWAACNGETNWQIQLNPDLPSDITAYSGGGNLQINLAGTAITSLAAETGGGNVDVVLPENSANLSVAVKTGGGNVTVEVGNETNGSSTLIATSGAGSVTVLLPGGMAARIHVSTGLGKLVLDPQFTKTDDVTYQSPGYDSAADKIEITVESGAGDVSVITK